jgi:hypothetical protein
MTPVHQSKRNVKNMNSKGFEPKFTSTNRITTDDVVNVGSLCFTGRLEAGFGKGVG